MFVIIFVSVLIGLIFAPLGCLVLWKRYVYFGDGLAHASMLAGIVSTMAEIPIFYAGALSGAGFALSIWRFHANSGNNAAIGFTSSLMVALSLVLVSLSSNQINITKYLIGDIILVDNQDVIILLCIFLIVISFLIFSYDRLVLTVLSRDIAACRGVKVKLLELVFLIILSFTILSTVKIVGALLVTSILIIPAMIARMVAKSPLSMIAYAIFFALLMNSAGIIISFHLDLPCAPVMILSGAIIYFFINYTFKNKI